LIKVLTILLEKNIREMRQRIWSIEVDPTKEKKKLQLQI